MRLAHAVRLQHRIDGGIGRRRHAKLTAERGHAAGEPVELEAVAALEIVQQRSLEAIGRVLREGDLLVEKLAGIFMPFACPTAITSRIRSTNSARVSASARMAPSGWRVEAVAPERPTRKTNFFQRSRSMLSETVMSMPAALAAAPKRSSCASRFAVDAAAAHARELAGVTDDAGRGDGRRYRRCRPPHVRRREWAQAAPRCRRRSGR